MPITPSTTGQCHRALLTLACLLLVACGDPVAEHVQTVLAGGDGREDAMMELLFAKSKALPAILRALEDSSGSARGRTDLVEILWKLHVRESDARILPALTERINDPAPEVRRAVAVAFGDMGDKDVIPRLLEQLAAERDESVQDELLKAIEVLDEWELRGPGRGSGAIEVLGGASLSAAQRETFTGILRSIVAVASSDSLRQTADEFLAKMAGQLAAEGDRAVLKADLEGSEALYRSALELRPGTRVALQRLGQLFLFNGDRELGLEVLSDGGMVMRAPRLTRIPILDGQLGDAAWREAAYADTFFQCISVMRAVGAEGRSEAWVGYTDSSLWVGVRGYEEDTADLTTEHTDRDGLVHTDDCVEVHFDVDLDRRTFHQIVVNSLGTIADFHVGRVQNFDSASEWNGDQRVATAVEPTHWMLEMEVPFRTLGIEAVRAGDLWGFNVARVRIAHGGEYDQWVPTYGYSGRPDRFGLLLFE